MIGEKVRRYQGRGTDLNALRGSIEDYLRAEGFKVQSSAPSPHGILVQAQKGGFLQGIIAADRAFNILIDGEPDDFTVRVGIGKWVKHLAVTAVETLLLSELFLAIDVPEMLWNLEIERRILDRIDGLMGTLPASPPRQAASWGRLTPAAGPEGDAPPGGRADRAAAGR